ncbi:MAG: response regulator [Sphingomonas sp.]
MNQPLAIAGSTVLLVEDEYLIADDLARDLTAHGLTVFGPVATVEAAVEALAQSNPDFAILDINLRGDRVFPLADHLSGRDIPYVFATGYDGDAIPPRFADVARLEKPIRTGDLLVTLENLSCRSSGSPTPEIPPLGDHRH